MTASRPPSPTGDTDLRYVRRSFLRHLAADRRATATRAAYGAAVGQLEAFLARQGLPTKVTRLQPDHFQDNDYMLGSVCHPDPVIRRKALEHLLDCVDIMDATGSRDLKLWFADGTNYPGQDDLRERQDRLAEVLASVSARIGPNQRIVLERVSGAQAGRGA